MYNYVAFGHVGMLYQYIYAGSQRKAALTKLSEPIEITYITVCIEI